jgi:hypothetical protein
MGLACHLAELIDDIRNMRSDASNLSITGGTEPSRGKGNRPVDRAKSDAQAWIDTLNRDFSNLRDAVSRRMGSLIEPVASRFSEHLLALAETRPALTVKCLDLDRQINALSGRISGASEAPDDESTQ